MADLSIRYTQCTDIAVVLCKRFIGMDLERGLSDAACYFYKHTSVSYVNMKHGYRDLKESRYESQEFQ